MQKYMLLIICLLISWLSGTVAMNHTLEKLTEYQNYVVHQSQR